MNFINRNDLFKELLRRHGKGYTYIKVCQALNGSANATTDKEKKQILSVIDEMVKQTKENILKS